MSKKNWISIKRGLSEDPKHRQAMGDAIWLFMHICDAADWEKGIVYDWRDKEIGIDMSLNSRTVRDWRDRLSKLGYITCVQRQHCLEIIIHNWTNPRDYGGKKMNVRQGDMAVSPSKEDKIEEKEVQGDTQGDTQGIHESIGKAPSFIESTSTSKSTPPVSSKKVKKYTKEEVLLLAKNMDWLIVHRDQIDDDVWDEIVPVIEKQKGAKEATDAFERALVFNPLPWGTKQAWNRLERFLIEKYVGDPQVFQKYQIWRDNKGKYEAMSNKQIYADPDKFIACWPQEFDKGDDDPYRNFPHVADLETRGQI